MTQMVDREQLIAQLTSEVTRNNDPASPDLRLALEQLIDEVLTGEAGERPIDWAYLVSQAVLMRHEGQ